MATKKKEKFELSNTQKDVLLYTGVAVVGYLIYKSLIPKNPADEIKESWIKANGISQQNKNFTIGLDERINELNIYYYPEFINKLCDKSADDIAQINKVWNKYYLDESEGLTLLEAIENEDAYLIDSFFQDHAYQPAIDCLKALGY